MSNNNILPVRFMQKEQYKELKDNGSFTGVNTFTGEEETVKNIPQALNCVADTTEQDIAKVQYEVAEVKEQVANVGGKMYLHNIRLMIAPVSGATEPCSLFLNIVSSKSTKFAGTWEMGDAIGATVSSASCFFPCWLSIPKDDGNVLQASAIVRITGNTSGLVVVDNKVTSVNIIGIDGDTHIITEI